MQDLGASGYEPQGALYDPDPHPAAASAAPGRTDHRNGGALMARQHGCQICGTGNGFCRSHAARIKETVRMEGHVPGANPPKKKWWK